MRLSKSLAVTAGWWAAVAFMAASHAAEPKPLTEARAEFVRATAKGVTEEARVSYLTKLTRLRAKLVPPRGSGKAIPPEIWQSIDHEIALHPAPASVDAKAETELLVGKWRSPRHDYLYRADGTWTMLPEKEDGVRSTHGKWRIEGNQCIESVEISGEKPGRFTILLLTKTDYVVSSGGTTFYRERL